MNRDVTFGQHRDARYPVGLEAVKMDVQKRGPGCIDATAQSRLDIVDVVEVFALIQIDQEVNAGATRTMPHHRMGTTDAQRHKSGGIHDEQASFSGWNVPQRGNSRSNVAAYGSRDISISPLGIKALFKKSDRTGSDPPPPVF